MLIVAALMLCVLALPQPRTTHKPSRPRRAGRTKRRRARRTKEMQLHQVPNGARRILHFGRDRRQYASRAELVADLVIQHDPEVLSHLAASLDDPAEAVRRWAHRAEWTGASEDIPDLRLLFLLNFGGDGFGHNTIFGRCFSCAGEIPVWRNCHTCMRNIFLDCGNILSNAFNYENPQHRLDLETDICKTCLDGTIWVPSFLEADIEEVKTEAIGLQETDMNVSPSLSEDNSFRL